MGCFNTNLQVKEVPSKKIEIGSQVAGLRVITEE